MRRRKQQMNQTRLVRSDSIFCEKITCFDFRHEKKYIKKRVVSHFQPKKYVDETRVKSEFYQILDQIIRTNFSF